MKRKNREQFEWKGNIYQVIEYRRTKRKFTKCKYCSFNEYCKALGELFVHLDITGQCMPIKGDSRNLIYKLNHKSTS